MRKLHPVTALQLAAACFIVIFVVIFSLGIINQILVTAQSYLVDWSTKYSMRGQELSTTPMLGYITKDISNVTTTLITLTSAALAQLPTTTSSGLMPTPQVTQSCSGISLTSQAANWTSPSLVPRAIAMPTLQQNFNRTAELTSLHNLHLTTPLTKINNQMILTIPQPISTKPTNFTPPATPVGILQYSQTAASAPVTYVRVVPPIVVYYEIRTVLLLLLGIMIVAMFLVWAIITFTDTGECYVREIKKKRM